MNDFRRDDLANSAAQADASVTPPETSYSLQGRREAILAQVQSIPPFPAVANQILAVAQDQSTHVREIAQLIEYDMGLTTSVLRFANSPYFAGTHPIGTVQEAIVRLGVRRLVDLVVTAVTAPLAKRPIHGYDLAAGQLFEHSIIVAIGVEALAAEIGEQTPHNAFTAGLLHDLGKIVLGTFVDVDVHRILDEAFRGKRPFEEAESCVLGINHAEVGALLLQHWALPHEIVKAVQFHHIPDVAPEGSHLVDLVHVSDQLALNSGIGAGIDGLQYRTSRAALARLNLELSAIERVMCRMLEGLQNFRELIQYASGGSPSGD